MRAGEEDDMGTTFQGAYPDPLSGAIPVLEPEGITERLARKTPWWAISVGLHAAAAMIAGLFWIAESLAEKEPDPDPPFVNLETDPPPPVPPEIYTPHQPIDMPPIDLPDLRDEAILKEVRNLEEGLPLDDIVERPKGDDLTFKSDRPFKSRWNNDAIGTGGSPGGRFGHRLGLGKRGLLIGSDGGGTQDAVLAALKWLARHQSPDGSWSVQGYVSVCRGTACAPHPGHADFDAGVTGLSVLAFLGAGHAHFSREIHDGICFGDVVRKGLQWMLRHQDAEGCIGSRNAQKYMYNHTICALALTEAYGLTESNLFREPAQRAVDFTISAQNPGKGWRYAHQSGKNDSSVTGWAVMVLKSAEISGLSFPSSGYRGTRAWFNEVTEKTYSRVGYTGPNTGKVYIPGMNENYNHHETLTSIAMMARIFMNRSKRDPRIAAGCNLLLADKPRWEANDIDFYYWYYASLALYQYDGPLGPKWRAWNKEMKRAIVDHQNRGKGECRHGSWEPVGRWCCEGGRVYATAINALTLEVYYRYVNAMMVR